MSKYNNNVSHTNDPEVLNKRGHIEQRAEWMYLMCDEAQKAGHKDWEDVARKAIFRCGCMRGADFFASVKDKGDLLQVAKVFQDSKNAILFEREHYKITEDEVEMRFHYCPLANAWRKLTDDDEHMAKLCDIAMDGDRGMFTNLDHIKFTLDGTIAEGKPYCRILLTKEKED